ncbi:MAG: LptA/OstA family protein [Candidatus Binataceae bacterium]
MENPHIRGLVKSWLPRRNLVAIAALCASVTVLSGLGFAHDELTGAQLSNVRKPLNVRADTLSFDAPDKSVLWSGHVSLRTDDCLVTSNLLRLKYGADLHTVKYAFASGNVRIDLGARWLSGNDAMLDEATQTIALTGSPVVHEAQGQIAGTKIKVHLDTDQTDVEGAHVITNPR